MQSLPVELLQVLSSRLKLGERAKPVCRVEVDRLAFVPGRTEELKFLTSDFRTDTTIQKSWISTSTDSSGNPVYGGSTSLPSSPFVFPVQGYSVDNITSHFGMRGGRMHNGTDIGCPVGSPIRAPWSGKVVRVNRGNRYEGSGWSVNILHSNQILTKYFHLNDIHVEVGQDISAGDVIALSGNTGSVRSGGKPVTGSYSDPNSPRSRGLGAHLHFEIWAGCNPNSSTGQGGQPVDPYPYITEAKSMYASSINVGSEVQHEGEVSGYRGEIKLDERFTRRNWYNAPYYSLNGNFTRFSQIEKGASGGHHSLTFKQGDTGTTLAELSIRLNLGFEGTFDLSFSSGFIGSQNDELRIFVNGRLSRRVSSFASVGIEQVIKDVYLPSGEVTIRITIQYGGQGNKKFSLRRMYVRELTATSPVDSKTIDHLDPTMRTYESAPALDHFVFGDPFEKAEIQVGQFVYMDTLPLDNIISCEVDSQFEQECSEAKVTISNVKGYFSPDYNPYYFPEVYLNSPWSYSINGFRVGVLSENTPIRVYLGYGMNFIRVFTGLIDKVDMVGGDSQLTIHCRDMYKKIIEKVLMEEKSYPSTLHEAEEQKTMWMKSAIIQDLIGHAGMYGWRRNFDDLNYPDAVIEESYLIEINQRKGTVVKAVPDIEGEFSIEEIESHPTPYGWLNPFVEGYGKTFPAYRMKIADCINETVKDTHYISYCDRYGTYRLETLDLNKPIVDTFTEHENLITINQSIDFSRGRSHIVVFDSEGKYENFIDKEILLELKGEVRTATVDVPWATSFEAKRDVARRLFFDMKRLCRTLQVSIPGNPGLDLLDRVRVINHNTTTRSVYTIKGIRHAFSVDNGYLSMVDLMWSEEGAVV